MISLPTHIYIPDYLQYTMIKAIILDVDNTLVDFYTMKEKAVEAAIKAMINAGLRMDFDDAYNKLMKIYWKVGIESNEWLTEFLSKYDKVDDIKIAVATNAYRKIKSAFLEPYPTVIPTLIYLIKKGIKLAVLSDAPKLKALKRLDAMKLLPFFDIIIADANKPNIKGFEKVLKGLNVKAKEALMLGDRPDTDVKGAKNAGIKICFAKYGSRTKNKLKTDYEAEHFYDLIEIIKKENGTK